MYPQSCLCEEAKIKQYTSSKKELCKIGKEAVWESQFTCFFRLLINETEIRLTRFKMADLILQSLYINNV